VAPAAVLAAIAFLVFAGFVIATTLTPKKTVVAGQNAESAAPPSYAPTPAPSPVPSSPSPVPSSPSPVPSPPASSAEIPTVNFTIVNNTSTTVHVAFFDGSNRARVDPLDGRHYIHSGNNTQTYRVSCTPGQNVCYGAATQGPGLKPFWGVGGNGKENCTGCCMSCPAAYTVTKTLNASDSRQPAPTITWTIVDNTRKQLAIAFYSDTRRGHGWPDYNKNWPINNRENTYTLSCQAGERICYGAWAADNPYGPYWGTGPFGKNRCTNCCGVCDGGTYSASFGD
jgi:hypothetical protein